jgi:hypothetical protein
MRERAQFRTPTSSRVRLFRPTTTVGRGVMKGSVQAQGAHLALPRRLPYDPGWTPAGLVEALR